MFRRLELGDLKLGGLNVCTELDLKRIKYLNGA